MLFNEDDSETAPIFRRRKVPEADLDMTPMIDVTFLLLIFFMVAGKMTTDAMKTIDLPAAKFGVGVIQPAASLVILRFEDGRARVEVENREVELPELKTWLTEQVLRNRRQVILEAERTVPFRVVQETTRAIMEVNGVEFFVGVKDD